MTAQIVHIINGPSKFDWMKVFFDRDSEHLFEFKLAGISKPEVWVRRLTMLRADRKGGPDAWDFECTVTVTEWDRDGVRKTSHSTYFLSGKYRTDTRKGELVWEGFSSPLFFT